jgi:hypothetical protein
MKGEELRARRIAERCLSRLRVDLSGLTIFTEAASGPYAYTPLVAARAGAAHVYAVTADSKFGEAKDIRRETERLAESWGVADRIEVLLEKSADALATSDIVTNTGFVRPITREMINSMKRTAVVALMWEPWEFRSGDVDLEACREHEILVMGTNEGYSSFNLYPSTGFLAMKLLFDMGLDGFWTRVILLGGRPGMGQSISSHFRALQMPVQWFAADESDAQPYDALSAFFEAHGADYDVLFLAEHHDPTLLIGTNGLLTFEQILRVNPRLEIALMAGNVDVTGLKKSGLMYFPHNLREFGYLNYSGHNLGNQTVLALTTLGLKVGEAMARARLAGMSLRDASSQALRTSPAMAFPDDQAWR